MQLSEIMTRINDLISDARDGEPTADAVLELENAIEASLSEKYNDGVSDGYDDGYSEGYSDGESTEK